MKIVCASPYSPVFDRTLHYYQAAFSAAAQFFRDRFVGAEVVIECAGLTGATERTIVRHFVDGDPVDYLVLWVRPWEAQEARQLALLIRAIDPRTRILIWGDACYYIRHFFKREPFDLVVVSGDAELVLADAIARLEQGLAPEHGVLYRDGSEWCETAPGRILEPELWPFPAPDVVEPEGYRLARLQRGKPTDDLSFTISRGCPVNCARWCPTPRKEGLKDRRRPVVATLEYMARGPEPYELFQLHSPLFTQDRAWIDEFLRRKGEVCPEQPFKSVDLLNPYADEGLVARLAEGGLRSVGFGIETLSADRSRNLIPKLEVRLVEQVAANFRRHGVEGKAYIQLGLPGQKREDILFTHRYLTDLGFVLRPTGSTPFWRLSKMSVEELDALDLRKWDRKSYYDPRCGLSHREFFQMITAPARFVPQAA